jgi:hypothetical protein
MSEQFDRFEKLDRLEAQPSLNWFETWFKALTQPTEESYNEIVADADRSLTQVFIWVALSAMMGYVFTILVSGILGTNALQEELRGFFGASLVVLICLAPLGGIMAVVGLVINSAVTQWMAGALGGQGTFARMIYVMGAYVAPLSLISSLIAPIPFVNCLSFPLGLYALYLNVLSIKVANRFGWGQAIGTLVAVMVLVAVLVGCVVAFLVSQMGPLVNDVFDEVMRGM